MAQGTSTIGYNDTLEYSEDGGTTWVAIEQVFNISLPVDENDEVERTHMSSPDRTREYTPGLKTPNEIGFQYRYNATDYANLFALKNAGTIVDWRHTLAVQDGQTTGDVFEYKAFVKDPGSGERTFDGVTDVSVTLRRTSSHTFTPGS